jgi:serine/threonine-protein kinase
MQAGTAMAARSPVSSVKDFLQILEQSGLATPELLARLRQRPDTQGDARTVARELVQAGTLTRWQAGQLLHGFYNLSIGKYRLLDQLESGPWGRAYLAEHVPMGRRHVLRVLSREWAGQPQRVQQFLDAARRASRLDHPHLCHVYDVSQEQDRPYVVLEHVEGQSLWQRVKKDGPLTPAEAVAVAAQIADGLAHAHERGMFHPRLDPSQVVGDAAGVVKVIGLDDVRTPAEELGPAAASGTSSERPADASASGEVAERSGASNGASSREAAGPLAAMQSPQRRAGQMPSAADDVYALGSTLAFLLTGRVAEDAGQAGRVLGERGGLSDELISLCRKLMAAAPADRPQSMAAVRASLEALAGKLAGQGDTATDEVAAVVALAEEAGGKPASAALDDLKNLPVAKPLPAEDAVPVLTGSKPARADDQVPVVTVSVGAKSVKKGAAKGADRAASSSTDGAASKAPPAAAPAVKVSLSRKTLLVGGAVAAAVVLVAAGGLGYWLLAGRRGTVVAQVAPAAKSKSTAAALPTQAESNPAIPEETNPSLPDAGPSESTPPAAASSSPALDQSSTASGTAAKSAQPSKDMASKEPASAQKPADGATPSDNRPATAASAAPSADQSKSTANAPAAPTPADTAATAPSPAAAPAPSSGEPSTPAKAEQMAKSEPNTPDKPASPPPPAKPAPKAAAKPAPKPQPFAGLPKAVDLPPIPDTGGSAEGNPPAVLGPCRVDDQATLLITLAGGAAATRNPKQSFDLVQQPTSARHWDVVLTSESPQKVATLAVEKGQLTFAWQPELGMLAGTARLLSNCALILQTGDSRHVMALRKPVLGEPLRIDLDKPASVRWTIPDLPPARQLQLAVTRVEGVKDIRKEPAEPVAPGNALSVWMGPSDKWYPLGLRLTSSANNRGVTINFQPQIKLQGFNEPQTYRRKDIPVLQQRAAAELDAATKGLEQAKRDRPSTNPVKGPIEKELIEKRKTLFTEQLNNLTVVIEQLAYIAQFMEVTQGEAKVHFRISYMADDVPIDLLITEEQPPAPAGKK